MNRRGFLGAILAAASAPAIVRADALMRVVPRATTLLRVTGATISGGALTIVESDVEVFSGNVWATNALGNYLYSEDLSRRLRAALGVQNIWRVDTIVSR